jgi:hypothetical protein
MQQMSMSSIPNPIRSPRTGPQVGTSSSTTLSPRQRRELNRIRRKRRIRLLSNQFHMEYSQGKESVSPQRNRSTVPK